jgi:hypothetical protein
LRPCQLTRRLVKRTRHRSASYGQAEVELLQLCWLATDGICGKRLAPFLPELLRRLRHWHALTWFNRQRVIQQVQPRRH